MQLLWQWYLISFWWLGFSFVSQGTFQDHSLQFGGLGGFKKNSEQRLILFGFWYFTLFGRTTIEEFLTTRHRFF